MILLADADDAWSQESPDCSSAWSAAFRSGVSPGLHSSVAHSVLLCAGSFVNSSDQRGCRKQPEIFAKDSGSSGWLRKNDFAVATHQMLCAYPVRERSQSPKDDKGVLTLQD